MHYRLCRSVFLWLVVVLGRWSVEEPDNNPLQNDLGLVLKVIVRLAVGLLYLKIVYGDVFID